MKKRFKIFAILTTLASIVAGVALINNNNKPMKAEASSQNPVSGVFVKVTSIGDLPVGEKVIFVSDDGQAMDDVWGNPGYVHGGDTGVTMAADGSFVTLEKSNATVFTVVEGTVQDYTLHEFEQDTFSFRADTMRIVGQVKHNVYLAHNEKDYYDDDTFEYIGYFKDRDVAVEMNHIQESSWFVEFSDDPEDGRVTHIRNAYSVIHGGYTETELRFTYSYAPRFVSDSGNRVNIYREADPATEYSIVVTNNPTKTNYNFGDRISLSGLAIDFHSSFLPDSSVTYDGNESSFSFPETAYGSGEVLITVYYSGYAFTVPINVTKPQYSAYKIGGLADYRGSYMLLEEDGQGFNANSAESNPTTCNQHVNYNYEENRYYVNYSLYDELRLTVTKDNNGYHLKNINDKYLSLDPLEMVSSPAPMVLIEDTADGVRVKSTSGKYLYFDSDPEVYKFGVGAKNVGSPVILCKYTLTDSERSHIDAFTDQLFDETDVCDETGQQFMILQGTWEGLASSFASLTGVEQAEFVNVSYDLEHIEPRSMEAVISRYDYIYSKYHDILEYSYINDFIGRDAAGTMPSLSSNPSLEKNTSYELDNSVVAIVIIASMSGVVLLTSFIAFKKKRISE